MASENETVAEIAKYVRSMYSHDPVYFGPHGYEAEDFDSIADRIEAANKREVAELKKRCEEYERQPELMAETAKAALELLKSQDAKIAELRECLAGALEVVDCTVARLGIAERAKAHEDYKRWRKALDWERSK